MTKFEEHWAIATSWLPEFQGLTGFFFYSFLTYLVVLFFGWLLNPTVDKIIQDDLKNSALKNKGMTMRQKNLEEQKKQEAKSKSL